VSSAYQAHVLHLQLSENFRYSVLARIIHKKAQTSCKSLIE